MSNKKWTLGQDCIEAIKDAQATLDSAAQALQDEVERLQEE
jgi:hypothetical protein